MKSLQEILQQVLPSLSAEDLSEFCRSWSVNKKLKRYELLCPRNQADTNIYFIAKGAVKIGHFKEDQEIITGLSYTHCFVFNLPSFYKEQPTEFYIEAIKETTVIGITKTEFEKWLSSNLVIATFWRKRIEQLLLDLVDRQVDVLTTSPQERYTRLLERDVAIFQHIPSKYIAAYLGMTPETLSRLKH